jgi:hypothetical protein
MLLFHMETAKLRATGGLFLDNLDMLCRRL